MPHGLNTQGTGCPGFWELWVIHTERVGEGLPQPSGRPCAPCGLATSGGDGLLVYLYPLSGPPCHQEGHVLGRELLAGTASVRRALSTPYVMNTSDSHHHLAGSCAAQPVPALLASSSLITANAPISMPLYLFLFLKKILFIYF